MRPIKKNFEICTYYVLTCTFIWSAFNDPYGVEFVKQCHVKGRCTGKVEENLRSFFGEGGVMADDRLFKGQIGCRGISLLNTFSFIFQFLKSASSFWNICIPEHKGLDWKGFELCCLENTCICRCHDYELIQEISNIYTSKLFLIGKKISKTENPHIYLEPWGFSAFEIFFAMSLIRQPKESSDWFFVRPKIGLTFSNL